MDELISFSLQVAPFLAFIVLGFFIGRTLEARHYRSIYEREELFIEQPVVIGIKSFDGVGDVADSQLVMGNVVIATDYFKRFLAGLINLFGGRVAPYESLLDRARREALLRMQEQASDMDVIVNIRIETSSLSKGRKNQVGSVEAFAYGTALKYDK